MKTDKWGRELVPCKWCGCDTAMTGTKMCDACWELDSRVRGDPAMALRMLATFLPPHDPTLIVGNRVYNLVNMKLLEDGKPVDTRAQPPGRMAALLHIRAALETAEVSQL